MAPKNPILTPALSQNITPGPGVNRSVNYMFKQNNSVAIVDIPAKRAGEGFEDICSFIKKCPLSFAFTGTASYFPTDLIFEFWLTGAYSTKNNKFTGTILNGSRKVSFGLDVITACLRQEIPHEKVVATEAEKIACLELSGSPDRKLGTIKRTNMWTVFHFLMGAVSMSYLQVGIS